MSWYFGIIFTCFVNYTFSVGDKFTDETQPLTVTLDGEDITDNITLTTTIVDATGSPADASTIGDTVNTYTITYKVTYEGVSLGSVTRTVIVTKN